MRPEILNYLFSSLINLKGVGEKTLKDYKKLLFSEKNLQENEQLRIADLLFHLPEKILERKRIANIDDSYLGNYVIAEIKVINHINPANRKLPYQINCFLGNRIFSLTYYNYYETYLKNKFKENAELAISGKLEKFIDIYQIVHPDYIFPKNKIDLIPEFEPIYPLTYNVYNKDITTKISEIINNLKELPEWLDQNLLKKNDWLSWKESLINLHKPKNNFDLKNNKFIERLAFDELLAEQLTLNIIKNYKLTSGNKKVLENKNKKLQEYFINSKLPFSLTNDQKKSLIEIENDTFSSKCMSRLLQGDVGSGKTITAFLAMLNYIENRKQCVLMVPTSILATQHYEYLSKLCENENINIALLTGKIKGKTREKILDDLKDGNIDILIGTHALIEENVIFKDLAFVIIDEQHRFGVEQRLKLISKSKDVDILSMTATPIPRTLALTIFSDMEISAIREKPKNRKEIITTVLSTDKYDELIEKIKEKIINNNTNKEKIFWICPLVEESENFNLSNVEQRYEEFCKIFGEDKIAFIHGKLKESEKDKIMEDFANAESEKQILIATTVIEVGIDVKDATVIIIEHSERFGLSQLHQLRGRVGRGEKQSYCMLLYGKENVGKNTFRRLSIMKNTNNGFIIAEEDLKIRGIGDMIGSKQSGIKEYLVADLDRDFQLLQLASVISEKIIKENKIANYKLLLYLFNKIQYLNRNIIN